MAIALDAMLPLLTCPRSGTTLTRSGDHQLVSETGEIYPIVNGKPILVKQITPLHLTIPHESVISRNIEEFHIGPIDKGSSLIVLHLSCGNVPSSDPHVISMDVLPTDAADIVAEAEALPFRSGTIDRVVSGAVFEHLFDPMKAINEVRRILSVCPRTY
jgi:SAM-dependent methyltransferase